MRSSVRGRLVRRLTWTAAVLGFAGCSALKRGPAQPPATIYFTNESLDQATVYVVTSGADRRRIGTVIPGRTETLTVPADLTLRGTLNFVARLLARPEVPQTGAVNVQPGGRYAIKLGTDARILSFLPAGS